MDKGREICDKELAKMERKIRMEYEKALKEMKKKSADYFERFEENDKKKKEQVESGKLSRDEYLTWRRNKMLSGQYYTDMVENLSQDLSNAREHAQAIIRDELPDIYAESANWASYEVENGLNIDTGFTLVDRNTVKELLQNDQSLLPEPRVNIPKEQRWNKQKLNSAILQGVITGESIPQIAKRLRTVTDMSKNAAIRNARTMTTGAENRGRVDSYKRAEKMGIKLHQRWLATHDSKTRQTHRYIDGEVQEVGERFSNGCRYPADPLGAPAEVYNCRCTLIAALDDYPDNFYKNFETVDGMSYEEWKGRKAETAETKRKVPKVQTSKASTPEERINSILGNAYENHRKQNNLNETALEELGKDFFDTNLYQLEEGIKNSIAEQLGNLVERYDTSLQGIRFMNKNEYLMLGNSFASTYHSYDTDRAEIILNPAKIKNTERIKELISNKYAAPIDEKNADRYVITHEFAHSLLDMETKLDKKRNWVDADYKKYEDARKEIKGVYNRYIDELGKLESKANEANLKALTSMDDKDWKEAGKLSEAYEALNIGKYALTNADEFMAECFTLSELGTSKNKYVDEMMDVINKYFKR